MSFLQRHAVNLFYVAGSLCFLGGTLLSMWRNR